MLNKKLLFIIVIITLIILLPIIFLFVESFRADTGEISLANIKSLLLTPRQIGLMKNSLILAAGAAAFSLLLGIPLAFLINRTALPFRAFFNLVYLLPLIIPPYMHAIIWVRFFDSHAPQLSEMLRLPSIYSLRGGVFVFGLSFFPFVTLIVSSGLKSIDRSLEEAAHMTRGNLKAILGVAAPLLTPHITSAAILVFVFTIINFEVADILRLKVYPMEIFINFSAFYKERIATILSVPLITVTLVLIWGQMRYMRGKTYANYEFVKSEMNYFRSPKIRTALFVYPSLLLFVSFVLPVVQLAQGAGGFQNYLIAFANFKGKILYSIYVAGISSIVMVIFSLAVAYYIERSETVFKSLLDYLTQIPFGIPSIVLGIGLIRVWNRPGFGWIYDTSIILMIGYIAGYCPFVIRIVLARIKQINREMEEAALLANCSRFRFVLKILLPLSLPGMVAGLLAGFVLSIANLGTALLVVPAGKFTLPITIYNFMHYGSDNMVFALSLILVIIVTLLMISLYPIYRVSTRKVNI